jgi:hypothetical protein
MIPPVFRLSAACHSKALDDAQAGGIQYQNHGAVIGRPRGDSTSPQTGRRRTLLATRTRNGPTSGTPHGFGRRRERRCLAIVRAQEEGDSYMRSGEPWDFPGRHGEHGVARVSVGLMSIQGVIGRSSIEREGYTLGRREREVPCVRTVVFYRTADAGLGEWE